MVSIKGPTLSKGRETSTVLYVKIQNTFSYGKFKNFHYFE